MSVLPRLMNSRDKGESGVGERGGGGKFTLLVPPA